MKLTRTVGLVFCALLWAGPAFCDQPLREQLRHRLEFPGAAGEFLVSGQPIFAPLALQSLYERRGWLPLWIGESAESSSTSLDQVIGAIDLAFEHGLEPAHYHRLRLAELLGRLKQARRGSVDPGLLVDVELLASDALLTLADHLAHGRIDPETIDPEWFILGEPTALLAELAVPGRVEAQRLRGMLRRVLPTHPEYGTLVERLARQRRLATVGDWTKIDDGALLRPGYSDPRIEAIRKRLFQLGDLASPPETGSSRSPALYEPALEDAVIRFQQRHGLVADGVIGPRTLAALNTAPAARIEQLRANLERWRWLPRSLGTDYILVNIAGFKLDVISDGRAIMEQRVVVGTPYRRTPVFSGLLTYLVLNPSWEVPHKLAVQDQLPRIRENPAYLEEMGFSLLQGWGVNERRIDPAVVDWSALNAQHFPYRLRQAPGPRNALGRVKFMFPNPHSVYLHDTPSRGLFSEQNRALSSGCIRLEEPDSLMYWLLSERSAILPPERLEAILESGRETTVALDRAISVHLLYWTAWVDGDGTVQFRDDIYGRDRRLIEALNESPPETVSGSSASAN